MVASQVEYLNILQDRVCALVILQAKAVRTVCQKSIQGIQGIHEYS